MFSLQWLNKHSTLTYSLDTISMSSCIPPNVLMYDLLTNELVKDMYFGINGRLGYLNWDNQKVEPNENMFPP